MKYTASKAIGLQTGPLTGRERLKKEADHFRFLRVRFNKQGNLQGLSWVAIRQIDFSTHRPNLKSLHRGFQLGLVMYTFQVVSRTPCFLKAMSLNSCSLYGNNGQSIHSKERRGEEPPTEPVQLSGHPHSHSHSCPLDDLLQEKQEQGESLEAELERTKEQIKGDLTKCGQAPVGPQDRD